MTFSKFLEFIIRQNPIPQLNVFSISFSDIPFFLSHVKILKVLNQESLQFTDEQSQYLQQLIKQVDDRALPKKTLKDALEALETNTGGASNSLQIMSTLQISIPARLLKNHYAESNVTSTPKNEVVLSMYLSSSK